MATGSAGVARGATVADRRRSSRRRFLNRVSLGAERRWPAAVVSVPIVAYLLSPLLHARPQDWRDLGNGRRLHGRRDGRGRLRRPVAAALGWPDRARPRSGCGATADADFTAFAVNCTHLGCPVNWRPDAELFLCPCHGGVYYADGTVAGGPPPRPLSQLRGARRRTGSVQVLTRAAAARHER